MRGKLTAEGGATGIPSWGKFWLSILNVYSWDGVNPLLPELWLLPYWVPCHPGRMWCHARQIYLPMSYCYAHRLQVAESELTRQLRDELYTTPYDSVDWKAARDAVTPVDSYAPHHPLLDVANCKIFMWRLVDRQSR
jgi:lanosterol synthase